jgi:murein DD-endopeptidase MepM/ murein hydrolase activator NlpD
VSLPARPAAAVPLQSPIANACISSPFGPRPRVGPRAAIDHTGIDLPAAAGAPVRAAAPGRVEAVRHRGALGLEIDLRHADGSMTRYAHLGAVAASIANGRKIVAAGAVLGRVGRSGVTYGTHLHFELHLNGKPVDAAPYLGLVRCK